MNDSGQRIPGTTHWICKEKRGLTSLLIGSLRDLRVNYYKYLSKDKTIPVEEGAIIQRRKPSYQSNS